MSRRGPLRFLVEYSHPAQVHKFKHVLRGLIRKGHRVLILSRDKDVMVPLLEAEGLPHICLSRAGSSLPAMAAELVVRELRTLRTALAFRPHLVFSAHSVAVTHSGWLLRVPRVVHDDTEHASLQQSLYMPFATHIVTSTAYQRDWGRRQRRIDSVEPLAYLHPNHFTPDPKVPARYGLDVGRPYAFLRFIDWHAAHDTGLKGHGADGRRRIVTGLLEAGADRIVISCEQATDERHDPRVIRIEPVDIHHVLAFARLCLSEGGSVANEAAVLGVPTVLQNPLPAGLFDTLERYGLLRRAATPGEGEQAAMRLWKDAGAPERWRRGRQRLLEEKADMAGEFGDLLVRLACARRDRT